MASDTERDEGRGFKVQDRRRFSPDTGESRNDTEKVDPSQEKGEEPIAHQAEGEPTGTKEPPPAMNFSTFVISLSTQALMHLGEMSNPLDGKVEKDIPVAKQMIDIIGLLREKTRGNLDEGEDKLMDDILFDLRMRYVEAVKKK